VLIIVLASVRKKRRIRAEIEALLVSEMELEEQMLRLATTQTPAFYQSYGYLSPAQLQQDPGMMLGHGGQQHLQPPPMMLGAGAGQPYNSQPNGPVVSVPSFSVPNSTPGGGVNSNPGNTPPHMFQSNVPPIPEFDDDDL
jgi:hypothetical protein